MIWFKSCPRCKQGDLTLNEDDDRACMQCGYVEFPGSRVATVQRIAEELNVDKALIDSIFGDPGIRQPVLAG